MKGLPHTAVILSYQGTAALDGQSIHPRTDGSEGALTGVPEAIGGTFPDRREGIVRRRGSCRGLILILPSRWAGLQSVGKS
jgi:hypothetical protein